MKKREMNTYRLPLPGSSWVSKEGDDHVTIIKVSIHDKTETCERITVTFHHLHDDMEDLWSDEFNKYRYDGLFLYVFLEHYKSKDEI